MFVYAWACVDFWMTYFGNVSFQSTESKCETPNEMFCVVFRFFRSRSYKKIGRTTNQLLSLLNLCYTVQVRFYLILCTIRMGYTHMLFTLPSFTDCQTLNFSRLCITARYWPVGSNSDSSSQYIVLSVKLTVICTYTSCYFDEKYLSIRGLVLQYAIEK